jgi:hypothetical protein
VFNLVHLNFIGRLNQLVIRSLATIKNCRAWLGDSETALNQLSVRDLRGNNIPIDRRAQALRPYSNGFCPQCRGELRSPKRYIIKAQVPYQLSDASYSVSQIDEVRSCGYHT